MCRSVPTSRKCGGVGHVFWMPKFAVVESRVCGAGIGFWLAGKGFWVSGGAVLVLEMQEFWGWVDAVWVLEMKGLCR